MFETASEIVIWMVLAAIVGFATGWALRSIVANRARRRLSDRLDEKRHEAQDLREELRHLRGDDADDFGGLGPPPAGFEEGGDDDDGEDDAHDDPYAEPSLGATAEHEEVELGPLDDPEPEDDVPEETGSSTRAMRLDEVEWEDIEESPPRRDDDA
jgi:hypothetical protein